MPNINITKRQLKKLYYKDKYTRSEIASKLKVSLSTIRRHFKKYNIYKIGKICRCIDCGKSIAFYAKRCRKCAGIQTRKRQRGTKRPELSGINAPTYKHGRCCLSNKKYCIDCGKKLHKLATYNFTERCRSCNTKHLFKIGILNTADSNNSQYKSGKSKCIDCGKLLSNYTATRCVKCWGIFERGINNPAFGIKQSGKKNGNYKNGITIKKNYCVDCGKRIVNCYATRCHSCDGKKKYENLEYKSRMLKITMKSMRIKPNKPEKIILTLLNKLFPKQYKYVGDGKCIIGGFCPDFININGKKKIIEHNGDYWHNRSDIRLKDKRKMEMYSSLGYQTLIVWEHELKTPQKVLDKLIKFNEER